MSESNEQRPRLGRPPIYTGPRKRITLELPLPIVEQLDSNAYRMGISRTRAIEAAIDGWLDHPTHPDDLDDTEAKAEGEGA